MNTPSDKAKRLKPHSRGRSGRLSGSEPVVPSNAITVRDRERMRPVGSKKSLIEGYQHGGAPRAAPLFLKSSREGGSDVSCAKFEDLERVVM